MNELYLWFGISFVGLLLLYLATTSITDNPDTFDFEEEDES